jgi:hypothetical protein
MDVYIFQADIYCESCGKGLRMEIPKPPHADRDDESTYDSDEWPKGPYGDGGGEADGPQHCGMCGLFLDNPLTPDGEEYVIDLLAEKDLIQEPGETAGEFADRALAAGRFAMAEWIAAYDWLFPYQEEED